MTNDRLDKLIEGALKRREEATPLDQAAVNRVLQRLSPPLPRQKLSLWRLPSVLLDWQFAPAWPRVAMLACCGALGFYIGIAGVDRQFDRAGGRYELASRADIGSIVFEPETLTGAQP
jgi:hypothetical protein